MKRILSVVLAIAILLTMTLTAFAATPTTIYANGAFANGGAVGAGITEQTGFLLGTSGKNSITFTALNTAEYTHLVIEVEQQYTYLDKVRLFNPAQEIWDSSDTYSVSAVSATGVNGTNNVFKIPLADMNAADATVAGVAFVKYTALKVYRIEFINEGSGEPGGGEGGETGTSTGSQTGISALPHSNTADVKAKYVEGGEYLTEAYSVNISWGAMEFTYTTAGRTWDAVNHKWVEQGTAGWSASGNTITLENHSSEAVNAGFTFAKDASVAGLDALTGGSFTYDNAPLSAQLTLAAPTENVTEVTSYVVTFNLEGTISDALAGDTFSKIGTITVALSAAE